MKRGSLWMSLVLAGSLAGCGGQTINVVYFPLQQKVVLHPNQGDVIQWKDQAGNPLTTVSFPLGSPCKSAAELSQGKCTIDVPNTNSFYQVPYLCTSCTDPEIVVGSGSGPGMGESKAAVAAAPTALVQMACVSNQVTIFPTEATIPKATVAAGATVGWAPGGIPPIADDWKADGFSTTICTNSSPFNSSNSTCNLMTNLSPGSTTYTVSSASCNNTSAPGKITITP
jgi:hypothetical protein